MIAADSEDLMFFKQFAAPIDTPFAINNIPGAHDEVEPTLGEELDGGCQQPILGMDIANRANSGERLMHR